MSKLISAIIIFFLVIFFLLTWYKGLESPQVLIKPTPPSMYTAWIPNWDQERAIKSLEQSNNKLSYVSPVWYRLDSNGKLQQIDKVEKERIKNVVNNQNVKLMPTIFNDFDGQRVSLLITDPQLTDQFIQQLIDTAKQEGYIGWDIDFEQLDIKDKDNFSKFIKLLGDKLHQNNLMLSVSVHVQTGKSSDWSAAKVFDWEVLAKEVDFIRIMAYDFHNTNTAPGPITPINRYKEVLRYAISVIPSEKIVVGLPLYGYKWSQENDVPVDYQLAQDLSKNSNFEYIRDKDSQALTGSYEDGDNKTFTIWLEDAQSVESKINIARLFGIYQFSFWRLGGEDPNIWITLK